MAGGVVQRGGVYLHQHALRGPESLHRGGVQRSVRGNVVHFGQQQDKVLRAEVELGVPVVLQAVQFGVVTVAPAQLEGHAPEQARAHLLRVGGRVQLFLPGDIVRTRRQRRFLQRVKQGLHGIPLHHTPVGTERLVRYTEDFHIAFLQRYSLFSLYPGPVELARCFRRARFARVLPFIAFCRACSGGGENALAGQAGGNFIPGRKELFFLHFLCGPNGV